MRAAALFVVWLLVVSLLACAAGPEPASRAADAEAVAVGAVLDDWHAAAAAADEERYFGHFAPDGVFLGTDPDERWSVEEFREYARPHFSAGRGWTYRPGERHVTLSDDGRLAWFDERLHSDKYGALRGSGVLRKLDGGWKLAQYNMTFTIPNESTAEVVALLGREAAAD